MYPRFYFYKLYDFIAEEFVEGTDGKNIWGFQNAAHNAMPTTSDNRIIIIEYVVDEGDVEMNEIDWT